jgi:deoxyinosine 3'endonuclease (endonuclease V)
MLPQRRQMRRGGVTTDAPLSGVAKWRLRQKGIGAIAHRVRAAHAQCIVRRCEGGAFRHTRNVAAILVSMLPRIALRRASDPPHNEQIRITPQSNSLPKF